MLDRHLYGRLIDGLVARYPSYAELALFLQVAVGRSLPLISAPDALRLVAHQVIVAARAQGWLAELVTAAADDAPHIPELQEVRAALREPAPAAAPALRVALLLPSRLDGLAAAISADHRVAAAAPGGAHALVVGTDVISPGAGLDADPSVPVALVHDPSAGAAAGVPLARSLAASVTQIVVAGEPRDTARRVVDHLAAVVGARR